jgi:DNA-binding XRE family transcriptional regulator
MQFSTTPSREVVSCKRCSCVQFPRASGQCVKCGQDLKVFFFNIDLTALKRASSTSVNDSLRKAIGAALRGLRTRRQITQTALSKQLGIVGRSQLSRIESGHVLPPLHTFLLIATWLGVEGVTVRFRDSTP